MSCLSGHLALVAAPPGWRWDRKNLFDVGETRLSLTRCRRIPGARWRQVRRRGFGTGIGSDVPNGIRIRVPAAFQQEGSQKWDSSPSTVRFYPEEPIERKSIEDGTLEIVPERKAATQASGQQEQEKSTFPPIVRFYPDDAIEPETAKDVPAPEIVPEWRAAQEVKEQLEQEKSISLPPVVKFYPDDSSESGVEDGSSEVVPRWKIAQVEREQQEREKREKELARRRVEKRQRELNQYQKQYAAIRERELAESSGETAQGPRIDSLSATSPLQQSLNSDIRPPILTPVGSGYDERQNVEGERHRIGGYEPITQVIPGGNHWDTNPAASPAAEAVPGQQQASSSSWDLPIVNFSPDDADGSKSVGDGTSEVVPRWKILQAEREQQEREKRAKELARRRIERKQREMAQRQKEIAEMREREIAENGGVDPWAFLMSGKPASAPASTGETFQEPGIGSGDTKPLESWRMPLRPLEPSAVNKPSEDTKPSESWRIPLRPLDTSADYKPSGGMQQSSSNGITPTLTQDRPDGNGPWNSGSFSATTKPAPIASPSPPASSGTLLNSDPPGHGHIDTKQGEAGVLSVQQQTNDSSKRFLDDPSAARVNGDGSTDSVFSRRPTMAVREQHEREKRARELAGKVKGAALPCPSYPSAASFPANRAFPRGQDGKDNTKEGRQTGEVDTMTQGRIEFDWSPPQRSTEVEREKQEREKRSRETVRRKVDANAAATFALPFSSYPPAASSAGQHEREDSRDGRQTGEIGSMSQGTNYSDLSRSPLPGVVLPVQQQADTEPLESWRIPLPSLDTSGSSNGSWRTPSRPADPSGSSDESPFDIPIRRFTPEEREQQEREKRAKELTRRRLERKKRELAEKQRQNALLREKELADGTSWELAESLAPIRPLSSSETLLDPPTADYSSSGGYIIPGSPTEPLDDEEFFEHVLLQRKQTEAQDSGTGAEMKGTYSVDPFGEPGPFLSSMGSSSVERPLANALTPLALLHSPPAAYSTVSSSPTEALLNDEEFFEHVLLERKQSEGRVTGFGGEMQDRDSQYVSSQPQFAFPSVEYPTSAGDALAPLAPPSPIFSSALSLDDSNKTVGDGFPEVIPRRRLTQAEREQQEREKRAKELARRKMERKQREMAQKQKQWAEEREKELLENPGGASYSGGLISSTYPPPASYPAPAGSPSDGISGAQMTMQNAAVNGEYYDSRNTYGQPGYAPAESRGDDLVSRSVAYLQNQNAQNVQNVQNLQNGRYQPLTGLKSETNQPEIVEEKMTIWDDMDMLLKVLPGDLREKLLSHPRQAELLEVVLDLGRRPEARFLGGGGEFWREEKITREDLEIAMSAIGDFGGDNRAGIEGTLHRISAIRSRKNQIVGLTCRVGRAVTGQVNMVQDILHSGQSILFLGRPGVGKTTVIREMARVLSKKLHKRVVIVDTSNEIGGDGDVPHPAIGSARRMQVPDPSMQHKVMVEAVENHMPEVVIVDEVGTEADAMACRTIAERGVMLVATAHGLKLENIIKNPTLCDLVGGVQTVILGDEQARSRGSQKSVLERKAPPTFPLLIEMRERNHWVIHQTDRSVDSLLHGAKPIVEVRTRDENFKVVVSRKYYDSNSNGSRADVLLGS